MNVPENAPMRANSTPTGTICRWKALATTGADAMPPRLAVLATARFDSSTFASLAYTASTAACTTSTTIPISRYSGASASEEKSEPEAMMPTMTYSITIASSDDPAVRPNRVEAMTSPSTLTMRIVHVVPVTTSPSSGSRPPTHVATAEVSRLKPINVISDVRSICRSCSSTACSSKATVLAFVQRLNRSAKPTEPNISSSHTEYSTVSTMST